MVYCSKCGTLNSDDATICSNCGASLRIGPQVTDPYKRNRYYQSREDYRYRHRRGGSGIGALIAGIVIIFIGLSVLYPEAIGAVIWSVFFILIGVWLLFIGIRESKRRRRYEQRTIQR